MGQAHTQAPVTADFDKQFFSLKNEIETPQETALRKGKEYGVEKYIYDPNNTLKIIDQMDKVLKSAKTPAQKITLAKYAWNIAQLHQNEPNHTISIRQKAIEVVTKIATSLSISDRTNETWLTPGMLTGLLANTVVNPLRKDDTDVESPIPLQLQALEAIKEIGGKNRFMSLASVKEFFRKELTKENRFLSPRIRNELKDFINES